MNSIRPMNAGGKSLLLQMIPVMLCFFAMGFVAVSYTHLTLPTKA